MPVRGFRLHFSSLGALWSTNCITRQLCYFQCRRFASFEVLFTHNGDWKSCTRRIEDQRSGRTRQPTTWIYPRREFNLFELVDQLVLTVNIPILMPTCFLTEPFSLADSNQHLKPQILCNSSLEALAIWSVILLPLLTSSAHSPSTNDILPFPDGRQNPPIILRSSGTQRKSVLQRSLTWPQQKSSMDPQ
ncbi:hypothetical protein VFPPC_16185 [Pochonia chlamydosporia 170]|uniref:Uncharacterized protein n=1 Tax=Pochonia chlamydosporia 170 TaxID=1380566 RepID=A0A179FGY6_METCM|nr:hypothetical protein VFPPC_16185 [Pochonia chlamydosporia 170]OAQ64263.1 hypothetical protein VFPPC_16185 [Pochonia chlamydosporia 170]